MALGIVLGLLVGKPLGIVGATWLLARFTKADLDPSIAWIDVLGLSILAGIGFTVSLLIGELAFGVGSERDEHVKVAVLVGSLAAATVAGVFLKLRSRRHAAVAARAVLDDDADSIPDVYQQGPDGRPDPDHSQSDTPGSRRVG